MEFREFESIEDVQAFIKELNDEQNTTTDFEPPLPDNVHAELADGELVVLTQLCTRDGRRCGNATLFNIRIYEYEPLFDVITDAGNIMSLSIHEMEELFHQPKYILNDLPNDRDGYVSDKCSDFILGFA